MRKIILSIAALLTWNIAPAFANEPTSATAPTSTQQEQAAPQGQTPANATASTRAGQEAQTATITDITAANPELSTLTAVLSAAQLTETLNGTGPYTLFAPTNAAFEKLGQERLAELLRPENKEQLVSLLKNHIVPGKIAAADAKGASADLTTLQSATVKVDGKGSVIKFGTASVTKADKVASNGIVHEIDTVIAPATEAPKQN